VTTSGVICTPVSLGLVTKVARRAEANGLWGMAIGDSPLLYRDLHVATTVALTATERLAVGSIATNPVTRHWSIHASARASFEEIAPGRHFLAMASGNSAVRSFGFTPGSPQTVGEALEQIRAYGGGGDLFVTADGERMARIAGLVGDGMIMGIGNDARGIDRLISAAAEGHGGRSTFRTWLSIYLAGRQHEDGASSATLSVVNAMARRCLIGDLAVKGVPTEYWQGLKDGWRRYDMQQHATVDGPKDNGELFVGQPEIQEYLLSRFAVRGTPSEIADTVGKLLNNHSIDGVLFNVTCADPEAAVDEVGEIVRSVTGTD
jgi:alkanesulfonate monooxygenase SsuD/methylene tetrahydromethanopterin reductase-like flavin-dependent oxidoreductase (luciferase family)